nr:ECF-type sigma factor [Rhodopirellula sp. SM50]
MSDVTSILSKIESGDQQASKELLPLVYDELRKLAALRMAKERADHTLQATALVHEAYVRLVDVATVMKWDSRGHFFAAASEAMRRILIEAARARKARKRSKPDQDSLTAVLPNCSVSDEQLIEIHDALDQLTEVSPQAAELIKLRFFGGFSMQEIAEVQGISVRKAHYLWDFGRCWLKSEMSGSDVSEGF